MSRSSAALAALVLPAVAHAQEPRDLSFSVDWHGTLQGTQSTGGPPITAGDILFPETGDPALANPVLLPPRIRFTGGVLGLVNYPNCVGVAGPGDPCGVELDALSYGTDHPIPSEVGAVYRIFFSTDEYVVGNGNPGFMGPSVTTEGAGVGDASADVFTSLNLPPAPVGPTPGANAGVIDGNGDFSATGFRYPGVGIAEPNRPGQGFPNFPNDEGDNLDALDIGKVPDVNVESIFFSLDSGFPDPLAGVLNSRTAQFQGFVGGDVLERQPGGTINLYAQAAQLGLDSLGPDTDDLDVLILWENGIPGFQPSKMEFDWEAPGLVGGPSDMLLYSVRRGSAIIGAPDSLMGLPIEPGDLLMPPVAGGNGNPAIFIAAEAMGLATDRTDGTADEMNGGDSLDPEPYLDCNDNGIEDADDIGNMTSMDDNMNGIPDECEEPGSASCFCSAGPCGNDDALAGCANSTGGGALLFGTGSSSFGADDLVLTSIGMPTGQVGLTFMGSVEVAPTTMAAGLRCTGGVLFRYAPMPTGAGGTFSAGPGLIDYACANFPPAGCISSGDTWYFQTWYRDPTGRCGVTSNVTNMWTVTFTP